MQGNRAFAGAYSMVMEGLMTSDQLYGLAFGNTANLHNDINLNTFKVAA